MKRLTVGGILLLMLALLLVACNGLAPAGLEGAGGNTGGEAEGETGGAAEGEQAAISGDEIVIGVIAPLTGEIPKVGESTQNAAQMAVDEINAAGGLEVGGTR